MSPGPKTRKSVPLSEVVAVDTRQVNVAIEGIDRSRIPGSFSVHLLKDGQRIASRFFFQPSEGVGVVGAGDADRFAHFDFLLPIDVVAGGNLSVEVEPLEASGLGRRVPPERLGRATMRVYLMIETQ